MRAAATLLLALVLQGSASGGPLEDAADLAKRGDYPGALAIYRPLADQGDAKAQNALGVMYDKGRGVAKDDAEAVRWYRMAADQGNASAQDNLGVMYREGRGVPKDDAEAVSWFRKSAAQGNAMGQVNLGYMLEVGRGVAKDEAEAVRWYRRAAEQGETVAQSNLGLSYMFGRGVPRNDAEAAEWLRLAADKGFARAELYLGLLYREGRGVTADDAEAVKWFRKAAEQGNATAQLNLGFMHEQGRGVAKDDAEALRFYRSAGAQGVAEAQRRAAIMLRDGRGVAADPAGAMDLFAKAAEKGDVIARLALRAMQDEQERKAQGDAPAGSGKPAEAPPTALPAPDPERAELVRQIVEAGRTREQLARAQQSIRDNDLRKAETGLPAGLVKTIRESLIEAFDPDAMLALLQAKLAVSAERPALEAGLEWERSALGRRINDLELKGTSPEMIAEQRALLQQFVAKGMPADERARACAQADTLAESTESQLPLLEVIVGTGIIAGAVVSDRPIDADELRRATGVLRPLLREGVRQGLLAQCLVVFKDLRDDEFAQWLAFLRSDNGGRYARAFSGALRYALTARTEIFAKTVLDAVRRYKQDLKTSMPHPSPGPAMSREGTRTVATA